MDRDKLAQRLSQMSTEWTMVLQAHSGEADAANAALAALAQRYLAVVYRYLLGAVRDPDAAAELSQELALRILRGGFRNADPSRGRFRTYLKTALIHLVDDYQKARRGRPGPLPLDVSDTPAPADPEAGRDFLQSWRGAAGPDLDGAGSRPADIPRRFAVPRRESGRTLDPDGRTARRPARHPNAARSDPQGTPAVARQIRRITGR